MSQEYHLSLEELVYKTNLSSNFLVVKRVNGRCFNFFYFGYRILLYVMFSGYIKLEIS